MTLPKKVFLREEGPREGFQILPQTIPTKDKLRLIEALTKTGISTIEVTSFVRPDLVPQHADSEEVSKGLEKLLSSGVRFRALYLNEKGLERAAKCPALKLEGYVHLAATSTFLKRNNNTTIEEVINKIPIWINAFKKHNMTFERLMISTAFGDQFDGRVSVKQILSIIEQSTIRAKDAGMPIEEVTLADTTGWANPAMIQQFVAEIKSRWSDFEISLHLHDTRGLGMPNVYAGLLEGVSHYDSSVGGLGGCPFSKNAAGNVPTEDVAFLCKELGIETGVDLEKYIECAKLAEEIIGKPLPGKLKLGGLI